MSASQGWVVGSDRILHTADSGRDWKVQLRTKTAALLDAVDFVDARHGWVAGASELLATTDGGRHWRALPEPCPAIRSMQFVNSENGFAVAGGSAQSPAQAPYAGGPLAGGILLSTTDGGKTWQRLPAPDDVQTACFSGTRHGWVGARGSIYGTADGGRTWARAVRGPGRPGGSPDTQGMADVECAGSSAAWAQLTGPGAALSHVPQVGYHTTGRSWRPIFAEQYTASPAMRERVSAQSPGVYPGPFSAISPAEAVFVGWCPPCSANASPRLAGPVPMDMATHGGTALLRRGRVSQLDQAMGASFVTARDGWVIGLRQAGQATSMIMHTADGGRSWQPQYTLGP